MCLTYPASSTATFSQSVCFLCLRKEKKEKRSVQRTRVHRDTCFKSSCQQRGLRCSCTALLPLQTGRERWALSQLLKQRWICSLCDSRLVAHLQEWSCVCIQHCYSVQTSQALIWCRNAFDRRRGPGLSVFHTDVAPRFMGPKRFSLEKRDFRGGGNPTEQLSSTTLSNMRNK